MHCPLFFKLSIQYYKHSNADKHTLNAPGWYVTMPTDFGSNQFPDDVRDNPWNVGLLVI
jgi:hypothetical protein